MPKIFIIIYFTAELSIKCKGGALGLLFSKEEENIYLIIGEKIFQ
jgi:hypothetical protein